ncbi:Mitochondrial protein cyt-4 [Fulvia fulva]|nr:Mitochondrial protein cyt-4 [Fulvia fulva]
MLASRGGAVGKSSKDAYVCLSCRLTTQKRRHAGSKARYGEAAATSNDDVTGAKETELATQSGQRHARLQHELKRRRPAARDEEVRTEAPTLPSGASTTKEPDTNGRLQQKRGAPKTQQWIDAADKAYSAHTRRMNTAARYFVEHARKQHANLATRSNNDWWLAREFLKYPQYCLADASTEVLLSSIASKVGRSTNLKGALLGDNDYADDESLGELALNVLAPSDNNGTAKVVEVFLPRLGADDLPWESGGRLDICTMIAMNKISRPFSRQISQANKKRNSDPAHHFVEYMRKRCATFKPYGNRIPYLLNDVGLYPQYRLDGLSDRSLPALHKVQGYLESFWQSISQDTTPPDEIDSRMVEVLRSLSLDVLGQDDHAFWSQSRTTSIEWWAQQYSRWRSPEKLLPAVLMSPGRLISKGPRFAKHESMKSGQHMDHGDPFPPPAASRFVVVKDPRSTETLDRTIDEHLNEPYMPSSHATDDTNTEPFELRDATTASPMEMQHYTPAAFDIPDDESTSTLTAFGQPSKVASRTVYSEEGQPASKHLDDETMNALAALEEAASAAAVPAKTNSPWSQLRQQARRAPTVPTSSTLSGFAWQGSHLSTQPPSNSGTGGNSTRLYHSSMRTFQQSAIGTPSGEQVRPQTPLIRFTTGPESHFKIPSADEAENPNGIRTQLRKWQELHGNEDNTPEVVEQDDHADVDEPVNNLTRLPDDSASRRQSQQDEEEKESFARFIDAGKEGYDGSGDDSGRFLTMGDLVEIEYLSSERESILAVYVQSVHSGRKEAQFFDMQGRWRHLPEKTIMYSIPGWISPESVKPLLEYLPTPDDTRDMDALLERAYIEDLSVPREVAAPLVKRMVDFYNESQDIYRKNASTLDDAHNILAHDTDLRYGSLVSAATTLLRIPSDKLPLTALFTVRKALTHGGFAFNIDRRSHRLTGYMQIRSKEQVKIVENVREWVRQWQDDLAQTAGMNERQLDRRRVAKGAQHVYGFLEKARAIVMKNRETRHLAPHRPEAQHTTNNIGISKTRLPITETSDSVKLHHGSEFTADETEIIRFMESWACNAMFFGLPRIESLPPILLQATGLYDKQRLGVGTGFVFLQELGTIMPYENRIRFDQHLLLPSSQHSKPLQNLMTSLISMRDKHNFNDSMADLRHDWKDLPVYCIDDATAHEIDDGISVEPAGRGADGRKQHWVHVHIANPTAFFSRNHPLAKMARHMGETIYMPERTYMMLPRWATQRHFSLAKNRPTLTFSAKMDEDGKTIEQKITPGLIRNVISLTGKEVQELVSEKDVAESTPEIVLTVGGDPPPSRGRKSSVSDVTEININDLRLLRNLAAKRANFRKNNGGLFFNSYNPDVSVWQSWKTPGLAWDHPYRRGSRIVEGDPVIQLRTTGFRNWFTPTSQPAEILVRECMLLACEIAASWCSERKIPVIHRGTVSDPRSVDTRNAWKEQMLPAMREDGSFPMHLGVQYIKSIGTTVLATEPKRHVFLGMDHYSKVTSPLRRYGDMILHWQIEAALRHEAETGVSLATAPDDKYQPDRGFLPFSKPVLETVMLGLQPRESIITAAKTKAELFWTCMLLFRKHHFGEDGGLPFKTLRMFIPGDVGQMRMNETPGFCIELATNLTLYDPRKYGLPEPRQGDVWEVELDCVDVYIRASFAKPLRLIGREGAGIL